MARASSVPGSTSVKFSGYSFALLSAVSRLKAQTAASARVIVPLPSASSSSAAPETASAFSSGRPSASVTVRFSRKKSPSSS